MKSKLPVLTEDSCSNIVDHTLGGQTAQGVSFSGKKKSSHFFMSRIVEIYQLVFSLLKKDPTVFLLFVLLSLIDLAALAFLFLAPFEPASYILAPIIRTFWSDVYLHYPQNFVLLPKLYNHAHFLIVSTLGVFISGLAVKKIESQMLEGERLSLLSAAGSVTKRYLSLVFAWLLSYGLFVFANKTLMPLVPKSIWWHVGATFFIGLFIQSLAAFFFPALLILKKGFFRRTWEGLSYGVKHLLSTSLVIILPMFLAVTLSFFKWLAPFYVTFNPEIVLWVLAGGCAVMALVDLFITSLTTVLFLKAQERG